MANNNNKKNNNKKNIILFINWKFHCVSKGQKFKVKEINKTDDTVR